MSERVYFSAAAVLTLIGLNILFIPIQVSAHNQVYDRSELSTLLEICEDLEGLCVSGVSDFELAGLSLVVRSVSSGCGNTGDLYISVDNASISYEVDGDLSDALDISYDIEVRGLNLTWAQVNRWEHDNSSRASGNNGSLSWSLWASEGDIELSNLGDNQTRLTVKVVMPVYKAIQRRLS